MRKQRDQDAAGLMPVARPWNLEDYEFDLRGDDTMVRPEKVKQKIDSEAQSAWAWVRAVWLPVLCIIGVLIVLYWALT